MTTPDEQVTQEICKAFRKSKLLSDSGIKKIADAIAAGSMTSEDWRLAFEIDRPEGPDGTSKS